MRQLRTAQVRALNRELEIFNYSVSHDLRAPPRRIDGFVTELERVCGDALNAIGKEMILAIRASTEHMTTLIQALLKLATLGRSDGPNSNARGRTLAHSRISSLQNCNKAILAGKLNSSFPMASRLPVMRPCYASSWII